MSRIMMKKPKLRCISQVRIYLTPGILIHLETSIYDIICINFFQEHMPYFRRRMVYEILTQKLM